MTLKAAKRLRQLIAELDDGGDMDQPPGVVPGLAAAGRPFDERLARIFSDLILLAAMASGAKILDRIQQLARLILIRRLERLVDKPPQAPRP